MSETASAAVVPRRLSVPEYTYPIPPLRKGADPVKAIRQWETDPQESITLRSFTVGQELDAMEATKVRSRFDYELLQRICIKVDGKPVDQAVDFVSEWSPNMRVYAVRCLNHMSTPDPEDVEAGLKGVEIRMP
jgi:hypothetical protein